MPSVFLGLGSNIDPETNLRNAARRLKERFPDIRFSSVYRTAPRNVEDQAEFLNAVAMMETDDGPEDIADTLRAIERELKKAPPYKFGPRTIDLDLLLYGDDVIQTPALTVPHPRMHERRFVLEPLAELMDGSDLHPTIKRSWLDLRRKTLGQAVEKIPLVLG